MKQLLIVKGEVMHNAFRSDTQCQIKKYSLFKLKSESKL